MTILKMSSTYAPTLKEDPAGADIASHRLLLRSGMIRQNGSGTYTFLPLGMRVLNKIQQIIREERNARDYLLAHNKVQLEDKCWRALGTLSHARYLSSREALGLISLVRLGVATGIIGHLTLESVSNLYMLVQPGYLQLIAKNNDMNETERDLFRASEVQKYLA